MGADVDRPADPGRAAPRWLPWARALSWVWAAIAAASLLEYGLEVFVVNSTNHTGTHVLDAARTSAGLAIASAVPAVPVIALRLRTLRFAWLVAVGCFAATAAVIDAFNSWHVMMYYDDWGEAGMPERPGWSLTAGPAVFAGVVVIGLLGLAVAARGAYLRR